MVFINEERAAALAAEKRLAEIKAQLKEIDLASVRPLRAIQNGTATQADHDKVLDLESQVEVLRTEMAGLL